MTALRFPLTAFTLLFLLWSCGGGEAGSGADAESEGVAGGLVFEEDGWTSAFPTFARHELAQFEGGYFAGPVDVDGDGLLDVVALSTGGSQLVWFKNPTWEQYNITTGTERFIHMEPYDVDGDGDLDLAVASEFNLGDSNNGGLLHWAEAPEDPTATQEWPLHPIDAVPTSHRIHWADIDGDGRKELLNLPIIGIGAASPEYVGAAQFKAYSIPADPTGAWEATILDDSLLEVAHAFEVVDWDGDASEDILTASLAGVHLLRPALGLPPQHLASGLDAPRPNRGSSEVGLGSLGGGNPFIATIDPWHGTDAVVYRLGASDTDLWTREVIGTEFEGGHGLAVADFNADGYDEIVGGGRGGDGTLITYRYLPDTRTWERIPLDIGGVAASSVEVADLNGDGWMDVLALGSGTDNIVWYENQGIGQAP